MKILFIIHLGSIQKSSGIIEKVINQSKSMQKNNMHFKTIVFYRASEIEDTKLYDKYDYIEFRPLPFFITHKNVVKNILMTERIYKEYINACKEYENEYDLVYVRCNPYYHNFIRFLKKNRGKVIVEHNSIEESEYRANGSKFKYYKQIMYEKKVKKNVLFYVCVTHEIYDHQKKKYGNVKGVVIPNGIDVKKYSVRKAPKYDNKNINIIFVGNIRYWHGLERIVESIHNYKGEKNIIVNIYGLINQDDYITPLIKKYNLSNRVILHEYKNYKELEQEFDKAHIALGSLGCFKKNIQYASTLKNREYFSRGIPVIFSEIDDDISVPKNEGLFLKVKNDDSLIDMEKIVSFVDNIYKKDVNIITSKIRKFALQNLDYDSKMKLLKEKLNEVVKKNI